MDLEDMEGPRKLPLDAGKWKHLWTLAQNCSGERGRRERKEMVCVLGKTLLPANSGLEERDSHWVGISPLLSAGNQVKQTLLLA